MGSYNPRLFLVTFLAIILTLVGASAYGVNFYLNDYDFRIEDMTGDIRCLGTYQDPCISDFALINPNNESYEFYPSKVFRFYQGAPIKDSALMVMDHSCEAGMCGCIMGDGSKIAFDNWRCIDSAIMREDPQTVIFPADSTVYYRRIGIKNDVHDNIKWSVYVKDGYLDPYWNGTYAHEIVINYN